MATKKVNIEYEKADGETEVKELPIKVTQRIEIKKVDTETARVKIVGDTPLLVHAWSEKAKKELLASQQMTKQQKKLKEKEKKDPFADFVEAAYWLTPRPEVRGLNEKEQIARFEKAIEDGAMFGFPVVAFKKSMQNAMYNAGYITNRTLLRSLVHVDAAEGYHVGSSQQLCVIKFEGPIECSEDVVKVGPQRAADLRYRPSYRKWSTELKITLLKTGAFTMEDIITALDLSGYMNGVGEWRIERDGEFGTYHVEIIEE